MPDSQPDALLYARLLKCKGMGHALWYPGPNDHLAQQSYKDTGIRIGDLGVIRRNGTFDFLWNIAAPEDDPVNIHEPPQPTPKLPPGEIFPVPDQTSYISESEETVSQYAEVERGLTTSAPSFVHLTQGRIMHVVLTLDEVAWHQALPKLESPCSDSRRTRAKRRSCTCLMDLR